MIDVKHLSKSFGDHLVLDDISEHVSPGENVVIIGPSGSGKSTFLRCLNLLEQPSEGTIVFDGTEITDPKVNIDAMRRQMGMVFQQFNLFPHMTVLDNIMLAPIKVRHITKAEAEDTARKLLARVGLADKCDEPVCSLSGGQKQRLAIARVFLKNPRILLLDEATSALDNESEILVGQSLDKLAKGRTTLTIAHRLTTIQNADRILVLGRDGIEEEGSHEALLAKQGVYYRLWNGLVSGETL